MYVLNKLVVLLHIQDLTNCDKRDLLILPMVTMELEKESIWNDNRYAPRRNPRTGPNAAILYIQPETRRSEVNCKTINIFSHTKSVPQVFSIYICLWSVFYAFMSVFLTVHEMIYAQCCFTDR
jgi:hypothetical protein